jgi:hypothetical protein
MEQVGHLARASKKASWVAPFITALEQSGGAVLRAAEAVHIGRTTVYRELDRNPELRERLAEIRERAIENVEGALYQRALTPDGTADRALFLKSHKPEKYADRLNPAQVEKIRQDARREVMQELEGQIIRLPEQPREIVMAALDEATKALTQPDSSAR